MDIGIRYHLPKERIIVMDSFKINMSDKDAPNLNSVINLYRLGTGCTFRIAAI